MLLVLLITSEMFSCTYKEICRIVRLLFCLYLPEDKHCLFQHPSPFSKPISTLRVFALGALLSGLYHERRFINLEIRYEALSIHSCRKWPNAVSASVLPFNRATYDLFAVQVHKKLGNTHLALTNFSWAMDLDPKGTNNHIKETINKRYLTDEDDTNISKFCSLCSPLD